MSWTLDHVFFATSDPDDVEHALTKFGLTFTERRVHHGQGTANACASFENAYLEILRPHNLDELRSDLVKPLGLDERLRWRTTGACPFGLCFRPGSEEDRSASSFERWEYAAPYLPSGTAMPIVTPAGCVEEPLVFVTTKLMRVGAQTTRSRSLHQGARRTLTHVKVQRPASKRPVSAGVRWFVDHGLFSLEEGPGHSLELEWDHGREGQSHRIIGGVPIVVRW